MRPRKNKRRIDPRYFLEETRITEAEPGAEQANVRFKKGPCKGMTASEAMKKGCTPGPEDHLAEGKGCPKDCPVCEGAGCPSEGEE
tara:strand:+ start:1814 stop:2071 length:258 start_codon:yes stop_codon:yes gene_type:complete